MHEHEGRSISAQSTTIETADSFTVIVRKLSSCSIEGYGDSSYVAGHDHQDQDAHGGLGQLG